jgi:hypothetical protein
MKNVANRLIVFAVSALAFGTAAFAQTVTTAEIPFAFRTVTGTLPSGTYRFTETRTSGNSLMVIENATTGEKRMIGAPMFDHWGTANKRVPSVDFVCVDGACSLKALNTGEGALVYQTPRQSRSDNAQVSVISVPAKTTAGE